MVFDRKLGTLQKAYDDLSSQGQVEVNCNSSTSSSMYVNVSTSNDTVYDMKNTTLKEVWKNQSQKSHLDDLKPEITSTITEKVIMETSEVMEEVMDTELKSLTSKLEENTRNGLECNTSKPEDFNRTNDIDDEANEVTFNVKDVKTNGNKKIKNDGKKYF